MSTGAPVTRGQASFTRSLLALEFFDPVFNYRDRGLWTFSRFTTLDGQKPLAIR